MDVHTNGPPLAGSAPVGGEVEDAPVDGAGSGPAPAGGQACTPLPLEGCPPEVLMLGEGCPPAFQVVPRWCLIGA